jgi:hypothetical protein
VARANIYHLTGVICFECCYFITGWSGTARAMSILLISAKHSGLHDATTVIHFLDGFSLFQISRIVVCAG